MIWWGSWSIDKMENYSNADKAFKGKCLKEKMKRLGWCETIDATVMEQWSSGNEVTAKEQQ